MIKAEKLTRRDAIILSMYAGAYALGKNISNESAMSIIPLSLPRTKLLLNPGHNRQSFEHGYGGFMKGVGYEYELVTKISEMINEKLSPASFDVTMTRDVDDYIPEILEYKEEHRKELTDYIKLFQKKNPRHQMKMPMEERLNQISIVRYAEQENFDAAVHVHINDLIKKYRGKFNGFAIISSLKNESRAKSDSLAHAIHAELSEDFTPSDNKNEEALVKVGRRRVYKPGFMRSDILVLGNDIITTAIPSVLVECGYIYQKYGDKTIAHPEIQEKYATAIAKGITHGYKDLKL